MPTALQTHDKRLIKNKLKEDKLGKEALPGLSFTLTPSKVRQQHLRRTSAATRTAGKECWVLAWVYKTWQRPQRVQIATFSTFPFSTTKLFNAISIQDAAQKGSSHY